MKRVVALLVCMMMAASVCACSSSSSSATEPAPAEQEAVEEEVKEEAAEAEEPAPEPEPEAEAAGPAWEVGEGKTVVWTDSIGTVWCQIIVPVTNTGSENLYLSTGTMDLEDESGHLVDSRSMVSAFPEVLQPGETGVYYEEASLDIDVSTKLTVIPHVKVDKAKVDCIRYEVSDLELKNEEYGGVTLTGRVANTTNEEGVLVYITVVYYDANNEIVATAFTILSDNLAAGDKIGFSAPTFSVPDSVKTDIIDHYEVFSYPTQYQF